MHYPEKQGKHVFLSILDPIVLSSSKVLFPVKKVFFVLELIAKEALCPLSSAFKSRRRPRAILLTEKVECQRERGHKRTGT